MNVHNIFEHRGNQPFQWFLEEKKAKTMSIRRHLLYRIQTLPSAVIGKPSTALIKSAFI